MLHVCSTFAMSHLAKSRSYRKPNHFIIFKIISEYYTFFLDFTMFKNNTFTLNFLRYWTANSKPSLKIGSVNKAFFVLQDRKLKFSASLWKRISWNLTKFQLHQTTRENSFFLATFLSKIVCKIYNYVLKICFRSANLELWW